MANFNVEVIVDPSKAVRGSAQAVKSLGKVESAADKLRNTLRNTFAGIGVGFAIAQIVQLTDTYTNLQNRLRVVTTGTEALVAVTEELFNISRKTRSSFEGTVELYSRLAISAKELGVSQRELTQFTKSMNEAIILSGASGREANAGLIQLSQGIASGALRGDELRSVLEQLPVVADVIAKQMGITRGELRKVGSTGAITAQTIIEAFKNAREELEDRFLKTIPTISQSFQVLRNALVKNIGAFNTANGAARIFSNTLLGMADNMDLVLRSASALAITIGITLAAKAIPSLIIAIKALTAAMLANPFGVILVTIAAIIGLLISFGDRIQLEQGRLTTFRDIAIIVWQRISAAIATFINWFQSNFGFIADFAHKVFGSIKFSLAGLLRFVANKMDRLVGLFLGAFNAIMVIWEEFPKAMRKIFSIAFNAMINETENAVNGVIRVMNNLLIAVGAAKRIMNISITRIAEGSFEGVKATGEALHNAFAEGFNFKFFQEGVENLLDDAEKLALSRQKAVIPEVSDVVAVGGGAGAKIDEEFQKILRNLDKEIAMLKLASDEREIAMRIMRIERKLKRDLIETERELVTTRLEAIQSLTLQNEIYDSIKEPIKEYTDTLKALNILLAQGKINQDEFNVSLRQTGLGAGIQELQTSLAGELGPYGDEDQMMELQQQLLDRNMLIQQAREANLINEQEFLNLSLQANESYNQSIKDIEDARLSAQFSAASETFDKLSGLAKAYAGDQSKIYRGMFAVSKAFAAADTAVQIANALGKAANNPWPMNIAAMAQVASLTAGLIGSITNTPGFKTGGGFTVGGEGGPDSKLVSFRATPGEQVSIKTPSQIRKSEQQNGDGQGMILEQTIINTFDPDDIIDAASDQVFINKMERNQDSMKNIVSG